MELTPIALILMVALPALIVAVTAVLVINANFKKDAQLKMLDMRMRHQKDILPMRLQAYERMTLFLERVSPPSLITRVRQSNMTAKELQMTLISNIKMEFEHNLSQQLYVSARAWDSIVLCKSELIKIINVISASLPTEADGLMMAKAILDYYLKNEESLPTQQAIDMLKSEVKELYH